MTDALVARRFAAALAACAALLLPAAPALAASGSDGGFGYTWRDSNDGAVGETITWDAPLRFTPGDNDPPMMVPLEFASGFNFYGQNYNNIWVSDNGWISFTPPAGAEPTPSPMGDPAGPNEMLAFACDVQANSRLACQIKLNDSLDGLVVRAPVRQY